MATQYEGLSAVLPLHLQWQNGLKFIGLLIVTLIRERHIGFTRAASILTNPPSLVNLRRIQRFFAERYRSEFEPGNGSVHRASRGGTQSNSTRLSSFYLQSGSFLRCTNLTLGYNMPFLASLTRNVVSNLRIYASVNNTFSKYLGYNPEVDYNTGVNLTPGVDYGVYPLVCSYNLGARRNTCNKICSEE